MNPKQAAKLYQIQRQLKKEVVEVEAGDGAVIVQISGEQKVKRIKLDEDKIDGDFRQLEQWLESAFTQAVAKSQQIATDKMKEVMGDFKLG